MIKDRSLFSGCCFFVFNKIAIPPTCVNGVLFVNVVI